MQKHRILSEKDLEGLWITTKSYKNAKVILLYITKYDVYEV